MVCYRAPDQLPRMISFTATDSSGLTSEQTFVFINFESVDNPPVIDLNGNFIPGVNFSTVFSEGGSMIPVRYLYLQYLVFIGVFHIYRSSVLKLLSVTLIQKNSI